MLPPSVPGITSLVGEGVVVGRLEEMLLVVEVCEANAEVGVRVLSRLEMVLLRVAREVGIASLLDRRDIRETF